MAIQKPKVRKKKRARGPHWETLANYRPRGGDGGDAVSAVRAVTRADIGTLYDQYELAKVALPDSPEKVNEVKKRPSMGARHEGRRERRRRIRAEGIGNNLDIDA